jgi:triphosphatase
MALKHGQTSSPAVPNRERELKLECDSRHIGRVLHHLILRSATPLPESSGIFHATYFDTPDFALQRAGMALRIREHNGRSIQTIKAEGGSRGIALDRSEWESEVEGALDPFAAAVTPLRPFIEDDAIRARIQPLFVVRTRRTAFLIATGNSAIELALDRTTIKAGMHSSQVTEIELELKAGNPRAIFHVAEELARAVPLRLSWLTKSGRGYRLLPNSFPTSVKAVHPRLNVGTASAEAFQVIARGALSQIVQNEELWRSFKDPEALHQMRVGVRRLRTAIAFFKRTTWGSGRRRIRTELRWVAKILGPARDLDVLSERIRSYDAEDLPLPDATEIEEGRDEAYATLARKFEKRRFKNAILRTAFWIEAGGWLTDSSKMALKARNEPVERLAKKELARRWKRVSRDAKHIKALSAAERHALRMRIKSLRYGSEFFAGIFKGSGIGRRRKALSASLERLQDVLGEMNDLAVAEAEFSASWENPASLYAKAVRALMPEAGAAARRLRSTGPFWE